MEQKVECCACYGFDCEYFFVTYMQLFKGDLFKDWVVNSRLCLFGFGIYSEQIVVCTWQTYEENVGKK